MRHFIMEGTWCLVQGQRLLKHFASCSIVPANARATALLLQQAGFCVYKILLILIRLATAPPFSCAAAPDVYLCYFLKLKILLYGLDSACIKPAG